jgi:hypothetical protein
VVKRNFIGASRRIGHVSCHGRLVDWRIPRARRQSWIQESRGACSHRSLTRWRADLTTLGRDSTARLAESSSRDRPLSAGFGGERIQEGPPTDVSDQAPDISLNGSSSGAGHRILLLLMPGGSGRANGSASGCTALRCVPLARRPWPACVASAGTPPVKGRCGARVLGCACGPRQRLRFLP